MRKLMSGYRINAMHKRMHKMMVGDKIKAMDKGCVR